MSEPRPLRELLAPPKGYRFVRGLWVTHDLSTVAVIDVALPALDGLEARERSVRRTAAGGFVHTPLLVLAAADRVTPNAALPGQVRVLPVAGDRRLHAKFLLLQYERSWEGARNAARYVTRGVVTSANLTEAGLVRNREVWVSEDLASTAKVATSMVLDLVEAADVLAKPLGSAIRDQVEGMLEALRQGLPQRPRPSGQVCHSLDSEGGLLGMWEGERLRRLAIVSPSFAGKDSAVASLVTPLLRRETEVDLYLGTETDIGGLRAGQSVVFPRSVVADIDARVDVLRVFGVPAYEDDGIGQVLRRLHGKALIAWPVSRTPRLMLGSANFTSRGLGGANRELMVEVGLPDDDAATTFLDELDAVGIDWRTRLTDPPPDDDGLPPGVTLPPQVSATFRPDPGTHVSQGMVSGTLEITSERDITRVEFGGELLDLARFYRVALDLGEIRLRVTVVGWADPIGVVVHLVDEPEGFYVAKRADNPDPQLPPWLISILGDILRPPPSEPRTGGSATAAPREHGRFDLPYDRRLPLLVRASRYMAVYPRRDLERQVAGYLEGADDAEIGLALAVVAAQHGAGSHDDPLVVAFLRALSEQVLAP